MGSGFTTIRRPNDRRRTSAAGDTAAPKQTLPFHPDFGGAVHFTAEPRPAGQGDEEATAQTIARMAQYIREDSQNPLIRRLALDATAGAHTPRELSNAVSCWLRENIEYVEDKKLAFFCDAPEDAEVLVRPVDLVSMPQPREDCDGFSMLGAAMLRALGIDCRLKTVEADDEAPGYYSHIYVLAMTPEPVAVDAIPGAPPFPQEVRPTGKTRVWSIEDQPTMTKSFYGRRRIAGGALRGIDETGDPYVSVDPTTTDTTDTTGGGFDWSGLLTNITGGATKILGTRYGVPQLNPGQMIRSANGSVMYQGYANGQNATGIPGLTSSTGNGSMLLILAVVVVLVIVMSSKGAH